MTPHGKNVSRTDRCESAARRRAIQQSQPARSRAMTDDAHSSPRDRPSSGSMPTEQPTLRSLARQASSLATELAELRAAVTQLRAGLAAQIRTRRVEVVDDHGVQRVVMSASEHGASVGVHLPSGRRGSTCIELFGFDAIRRRTGPCRRRPGRRRERRRQGRRLRRLTPLVVARQRTRSPVNPCDELIGHDHDRHLRVDRSGGRADRHRADPPTVRRPGD